MNDVTSFLIYTTYGLKRVLHTIEDLNELKKYEWVKVEIYKKGNCQNIILSSSCSFNQLIEYATYYINETERLTI